MTPLQSFVAQGWDEHADDAAGVARRLPQGITMVGNEPELLQLANLAHHVYGEHLAPSPPTPSATTRSRV